MAFLSFISFFLTYSIGGFTGEVGGHPSSQMHIIMCIIEIMFKSYFSRFWPYYLLF